MIIRHYFLCLFAFRYDITLIIITDDCHYYAITLITMNIDADIIYIDTIHTATHCHDTATDILLLR